MSADSASGVGGHTRELSEEKTACQGILSMPGESVRGGDGLPGDSVSGGEGMPGDSSGRGRVD